MGDVTRLEKAIVEIDETYAPKVIFVVASAVIAVIGTDIKGVCRYMQEKVNAKQIAKDCDKKEEKTYQIIGASAGF